MRPWTTLPARTLRPRHEPPTIREALEAAADLSDNAADQIAIAAGLLGCSEDEIRQRVGSAGLPVRQPQPQRQQQPVRTLTAAPFKRTVVVEHKRPLVVERLRSRAIAR